MKTTTTLRNFLIRPRPTDAPNVWDTPGLLNRAIDMYGADPTIGRPRLPAEPQNRARIELTADAGRCMAGVRR